MMSETSLTLLYDGACPLCLREVKFLKRRDLHGRLAFVDIDQDTYDPAQWKGIGYREAMARIHAIRADGEVLQVLSLALRRRPPVLPRRRYFLFLFFLFLLRAVG